MSSLDKDEFLKKAVIVRDKKVGVDAPIVFPKVQGVGTFNKRANKVILIIGILSLLLSFIFIPAALQNKEDGRVPFFMFLGMGVLFLGMFYFIRSAQSVTYEEKKDGFSLCKRGRCKVVAFSDIKRISITPWNQNHLALYSNDGKLADVNYIWFAPIGLLSFLMESMEKGLVEIKEKSPYFYQEFNELVQKYELDLWWDQTHNF